MSDTPSQPADRPRVDALLLDVDGTLVDSTYLHALTWWQAFDDCGVAAPTWQVHRRIGMDGDRIVAEICELAGVEVTDDLADRLSERHSARYDELAADWLRLLPGARELVRGAAEAGVRVVLATSAPDDEFGRARELLDVHDHVHAITNGEDVEDAKPDPRIVQIALDRAGVPAERALFVGDATWDAVAARELGIRCVAVRTGGIGDAELLDAGFAAVVDDAAELLRRRGELW